MNKAYLLIASWLLINSYSALAEEPADAEFYGIAKLYAVQASLSDIDGSGTAFEFGFSRNITPNFSTEFTFLSGEVEADDFDASVDATALNFTGVFKQPVSDKGRLFGKVGIALWDSDGDLGEDDGTDLVLGFGLEQMTSEQLALRFEFNIADYGDLETTSLAFGTNIYF